MQVRPSVKFVIEVIQVKETLSWRMTYTSGATYACYIEIQRVHMKWLLAGAGDGTPCQSPWSYGFRGNCFVMNSTAISISDAREYCLTLGGFMFVPLNTDMWNHIKTQLSTYQSFSGEDNWWIGVHDPNNLGHYGGIDGSFVDLAGLKSSGIDKFKIVMNLKTMWTSRLNWSLLIGTPLKCCRLFWNNLIKL